MQQTETYKLNLIEPQDPFLPDGLNENTRKMEAAMLAHEAAVQEEMKKVSDRVAVFEARKFVYGHYRGTGVSNTLTINLGFTPKLVFVQTAPNSTNFLVVQGTENVHYQLAIVENGFAVHADCNEAYINQYFAFG